MKNNQGTKAIENWYGNENQAKNGGENVYKIEANMLPPIPTHRNRLVSNKVPLYAIIARKENKRSWLISSLPKLNTAMQPYRYSTKFGSIGPPSPRGVQGYSNPQK